MALERKLARWQEVGLIDAATRARIEAFEARSARPVALYALGGLGSLTIGIGLVSVVAANWDSIGKVSKLAGDLALGTALMAGLYRGALRDRAWVSDVLAGVYYAYTLASIALLGQVYQLGAPTYQALLTWSACTGPFMLLARGRLLGLVWLAGLLATDAWSVDALLDHLSPRLDDVHIADVGATAVFLTVLVFVCLARVPWLVKERPQISAAWTSALWTLIVLGTFGLGFVWYGSPGLRLSWSAISCVAVSSAVAVAVPRLYPALPPRARWAARALLAVAALTLAVGSISRRSPHEAVGAIEQVGVLGIVAYGVLALGHVRTFNGVTALIALRVIVMYFEVFGSMLDTGLGMIMGGVLTLLLAWLWKRKSPEIAARLGGGARADAA